jgi:hypothetical protein
MKLVSIYVAFDKIDQNNAWRGIVDDFYDVSYELQTILKFMFIIKVYCTLRILYIIADRNVIFRVQ